MGQCTSSAESVAPGSPTSTTPGLLPSLMRKRTLPEIVSTLCDLLLSGRPSLLYPASVAAMVSPTNRTTQEASPIAALDVILAPGDPAMGPVLASNMHRLVNDDPARGIHALCRLLTTDPPAKMNEARKRGERWRLLVGLEVLEDILTPTHASHDDQEGLGRHNGIIERTGMLDYHELKVSLRAKLGALSTHNNEAIHKRANKIRQTYFQRVSDLPRVRLQGKNRQRGEAFWDRLSSLAALQPFMAEPGEPRDSHRLRSGDMCAIINCLKIGNLTDASGVVRRYSEVELASPFIRKSLEECRAAITRFVRIAISILLEGQTTYDPARVVGGGMSANDNADADTSVGGAPVTRGEEKRTANAKLVLQNRSRPASPAFRRKVEGKSAFGEKETKSNDVTISQHKLDAADEDLLLKALKSLMGNHTWELHGRNKPLFAELQTRVRTKLKDLAAHPEQRLFAALDRDIMGRVKSSKKSSKRPRQDDEGVLPLAMLKDRLMATVVGIPPRQTREIVVLLAYLATLLNPFFQRVAKDLAESHGGAWFGSRPKSVDRMLAKLDTDHAREKWPRPCANVDIVRCALEFKTPEDLVRCYEACASSSIPGLKLLRTKNNFSKKHDAANKTLGYRSVVSNCLYQLPVTWGDLFDADDSGFLPQFFTIGQEVVVGEVTEALQPGVAPGDKLRATITAIEDGLVHLSYADERRDGGDFTRPPGLLDSDAEEADQSNGRPRTLSAEQLFELNSELREAALRRWEIPDSLKHLKRSEREQIVTRLQFTLFCNGTFRSKKARFVTEIELLLSDYLRVRKRQHLWYRIHQADSPTALVKGLVPYAGVHRHTSFLLQALKSGNEDMVKYFSRLQSMPANQVMHCACQDTGFSCLHFVAADPQFRFNSVLELILGVAELNVNWLDADSKTARSVAAISGNMRVQRRVAEHPAFNEAWEVLPRLFEQTGGRDGTWRLSLHWCTNKPLQRWKGVMTTTADDGREQVVGLELGSNNLIGPVPAASCLEQLVHLQQLYLNSNLLTGPIPTELGKLENLRFLFMDNNKLTGKIPSEIGNMKNLRLLGLSANELTGAVPPELLHLTHLQELRLGYNQLTSFPWKGISDLQELSYLGLYSNHIAGSFPLELTKLKELRFLSLGHNHFHGPIPSSITQLTELEDLNLEDNALSGRLPPGLSALQNLKELWLNDNRLSGAVPTELGELTNLVELFLHSNKFYGTADAAERLKEPLPNCYISV